MRYIMEAKYFPPLSEQAFIQPLLRNLSVQNRQNRLYALCGCFDLRSRLLSVPVHNEFRDSLNPSA